MRTLIKLILVVVVALLGYNYFFGTPDEKEQSRRIVGKAGELGREAWNLLRSGREKFREGKYDGALDRLETLYDDLRREADRIGDGRLVNDVERLMERRHELEERLRGGEREGELSREARRELDELTEDTEELMHEMEEKSRTPAPY